MTTEEALQFLRLNQPLPPTLAMDQEILTKFDEVREFFAANPDNRSVSLFLNAFGEGDAHGIYQLVEDTVLAHDEDVVVPELARALESHSSSTRYWAAQIAANYPRSELVTPLAKMVHSGSLDEKYVAVTGLEHIGTNEARTRLELALKGAMEEEIRQLILDVLAKWSMSQ